MKNIEGSRTTLLGVVLKNLRRQRDLSVRQLAEKSRVEASVISRLENGEQRSAQPGNLGALALALNVPAGVLQELGQRPAKGISGASREFVEAVPQTADTEAILLNNAKASIVALTDDLTYETDSKKQRYIITLIGKCAQKASEIEKKADRPFDIAMANAERMITEVGKRGNYPDTCEDSLEHLHAMNTAR